MTASYNTFNELLFSHIVRNIEQALVVKTRSRRKIAISQPKAEALVNNLDDLIESKNTSLNLPKNFVDTLEEKIHSMITGITMIAFQDGGYPVTRFDEKLRVFKNEIHDLYKSINQPLNVKWSGLIEVLSPQGHLMDINDIELYYPDVDEFSDEVLHDYTVGSESITSGADRFALRDAINVAFENIKKILSQGGKIDDVNAVVRLSELQYKQALANNRQ